MRLPSFQAPFQGKSGISYGNPRPTLEVARGGGRWRERKPRCIAVCQAEEEYYISGCQLSLVQLPVASAAPAGHPRMAASHPWGSTSPAPWAPGSPCPSAPSPGGQLPGNLATGSQVSLPPATQRKLFELARAFSEKTKMRKSKRKHLLKHQSYPFWPGSGWGMGSPEGPLGRVCGVPHHRSAGEPLWAG